MQEGSWSGRIRKAALHLLLYIRFCSELRSSSCSCSHMHPSMRGFVVWRGTMLSVHSDLLMHKANNPTSCPHPPASLWAESIMSRCSMWLHVTPLSAPAVGHWAQTAALHATLLSFHDEMSDSSGCLLWTEASEDKRRVGSVMSPVLTRLASSTADLCVLSLSVLISPHE